MSVTSASVPNADVQGMYYSEVQVDYEKVTVEPIVRMVPVLANDMTGPLNDYVDELKKKKVPFTVLPLDVEGKSAEEIKDALAPLKLHYLMQILLVRERTQRRVVENEEFTSRSNINVAYQYTTPLRSKLLSYWTTKYLEEQEQLQGLESMPSSMASSPRQSMTACADGMSPQPRAPGATKKAKNTTVHDEEGLKRTVANFEKTLNRLLDTTQTPEKERPSKEDPLQPLTLPVVSSTPLVAKTSSAAPSDVKLRNKSDDETSGSEL